MTTYLHQVIAAQRGAEETAKRDLAAAQQLLSAGGDKSPLTGLRRKHAPKSDAFDQQPEEYRMVQMTTAVLVAQVAASQARLMDVKLTRAAGNTQASARVSVDGQLILPEVPATFLLELEEKLGGLLTGLVDKLQVLDPAVDWEEENPALGRGIRASASWERLSTDKKRVCHVGVEPTDHQPAVVDWQWEDVISGRWIWTRYSGQLPLEQAQEIRRRLTRLIEAVKAAREEANRAEVAQLKVGDELMRYVFGDLIG